MCSLLRTNSSRIKQPSVDTSVIRYRANSLPLQTRTIAFSELGITSPHSSANSSCQQLRLSCALALFRLIQNVIRNQLSQSLLGYKQFRAGTARRTLRSDESGNPAMLAGFRCRRATRLIYKLYTPARRSTRCRWAGHSDWRGY